MELNQEKKTWLQKNIRALIALVIVLYVLVIFSSVFIFMIMGKTVPPSSKDIIILIINSISGFIGLILGFYFGSMESDDVNYKNTSGCKDCD